MLTSAQPSYARRAPQWLPGRELTVATRKPTDQEQLAPAAVHAQSNLSVRSSETTNEDESSAADSFEQGVSKGGEGGSIYSAKRDTTSRERKIYSDDGGLELLNGCVVVDQKGVLGVWNGFNWIERRPKPGWEVTKIAHDQKKYLWSLSRDGRLGRLTLEGWKSVGPVGNTTTLRDFAFDSQNRLWAVLTHGDVALWNGFNWQITTPKFRKVIALASDNSNNLWALNSARELGRWDEKKWLMKALPGGYRPETISFDRYNQLWAINSEGMLAQLSGKKWIHVGNVGGWRFSDISFFWNDS